MKITELLHNTHTEEITPIIKHFNGRCAIIPERQLRSGTIRKDNIAFITVPQENLSDEITIIQNQGHTFYLTPTRTPHFVEIQITNQFFVITVMLAIVLLINNNTSKKVMLQNFRPT